MPLTLIEKVDSRRTVTDDYDVLERVTRLYILKGTADDAEAKQFVMDETEETYLTLPRGPIELNPDWVDTDSGTGQWQVTVTYQYPPRGGGALLEPVLSFDTRGGTKHLMQAISSIAKQPPTAPDSDGVIGYDGERIKGADIPVGEYVFSETHYKVDGFVTEGYRKKLLEMSGTVNDALFRGHAVCEVLFLGASGSKRGDEKWVLTYQFAGSPNKTGLVYGDLPAIDKKGWEHLWIRYEKKAVPAEAPTEILPVPKAVYVEQVLYSSNFGDLGIGTI